MSTRRPNPGERPLPGAAASRVMRSRYCRPWAIVRPATAAYQAVRPAPGSTLRHSAHSPCNGVPRNAETAHVSPVGRWWLHHGMDVGDYVEQLAAHGPPLAGAAA